MTQPHPDDHGTFLIDSPQEPILLIQMQEHAQRNTEKPGEAFMRMDGARTVDGREERVSKLFHVDLNQRRITITETCDGAETARRVILLDAMVEPPPESLPTPPPPPGPDTPVWLRYPFFSADLLPASKLQAWAMKRADEDVGRISALPRRIRLFGERFQEILNFPQPLATGTAPGTGATLRALTTRRGVERRLVEGWLDGPEGHGTVWILEPEEDGGYWLATRTFIRRPGMLGAWTGPWNQSRGKNPEGLDPALRAILAPPPGEAPLELGAPKAPSDPEIGMFFGSFPAADSVPNTADEIASRVGQSYENKLYKEPLGDEVSRVTVFRGKDWETWVLKGDFPMGLDDTIRGIAARGPRPDAVTWTRMGIVPFEGEVYRALLTDGEVYGHRVTRAFLIRLAADGRILGHRLLIHDHGPISSSGWIGVPPITDFSLFTLNSGEA